MQAASLIREPVNDFGHPARHLGLDDRGGGHLGVQDSPQPHPTHAPTLGVQAEPIVHCQPFWGEVDNCVQSIVQPVRKRIL